MAASRLKLAQGVLAAVILVSAAVAMAQERQATPEGELQGISSAARAPMCSRPVLWQRQIGTAKSEAASILGVEADGSIMIGGSTTGALAGPNRGGTDFWVAKYSAAGQLLSKKQFGSVDNERFGALDHAGNILIAGDAQSNPNDASTKSIFIAKYGPDGSELWKHTIETCCDDKEVLGIVADKSNEAIVASRTWVFGGYDGNYATGYITKYGPDGVKKWHKDLTQFFFGDEVYLVDMTIDQARNVIVSKRSYFRLPSVIMQKYTPEAVLVWEREFDYYPGDPLELATNRYGQVAIAINNSVVKVGCMGTLLWQREFKSEAGLSTISLDALSFDDRGNVIVTGVDGNAFYEEKENAFVAKLNPYGKLLWKRRLATPAGTSIAAPASDALGNVIVAGSTPGAIAGPNKGESDAWIAKMKP